MFPGLQPVYRGANWNDDANQGAWYLNGNNDFSNWNYNIGGRLGYLYRQTKNIASAILSEWGNRRKSGFSRTLENPARPKESKMKRIGHLYEKLLDEGLIMKALLDTCKGKGKRRIVQKIKKDPRPYALKIKELVSGGFLPSEPRRFQRKDHGSGKIRDICSVPLFPDQVIHRLCVEAMKEAITRGMDPFCVGCVPGRGCSAGMKAIRKWARQSRHRRIWVLKADIRHFYANIDREKLFSMLGKRIKDKRFLAFLWNLSAIEPKGLAIGLYSSPWLANFYLQNLDHMIKERAKVRHAVRNVDDCVWMDPSRRRLLRAKEAADAALSSLGLSFKPDWRIFHLDGNDVDFVGYRIQQGGRVRIRKRTWRKLRRDCLIAAHHPLSQSRARSMLSLMGYAKNSGGRKIFASYLTPQVVALAKSKANAI